MRDPHEAPPAPGPSLSRLLTARLALAAAVPVLLTTALLAQRTAARQRVQERQRLTETVVTVCRATETYVEQHLAGVLTLARGLAAGGPPLAAGAALDAQLAAFLGTYDGFSSVLVASGDGRVLGGAHVVRGTPAGAPRTWRVVHGIPAVADRAYFRTPMRTGHPYVSEAFVGRALGAVPIVALAAPVVLADGRRVGIAEGSFDLARLGRFGSVFATGDGTTLTVLDHADRVIFSQAPQPLRPDGVGGQAPVLRSLAADPTVRAFRQAATAPGGPAHGPATGPATGAAHGTAGLQGAPVVATVSGPEAVAVACETRHGWRVMLQRSTAALEAGVREQYAVALAVAAAVALVAAAAARVVSRRIARPLDILAGAVQAVRPDPAGGPGVLGPLPLPRGAPREVTALGAHLAAMERRVAEGERDVRAALARSRGLQAELEAVVTAREREITARTHDLAEANAALALQASTDPLTGLPNRRGFMATVSEELAAAARAGAPCLLLYADLDDFKGINDTLGHEAGDEALVAFGEVLRTTFRVADVLGRLGGDEFIVLVYGAPSADAPRVRERLAAALAARNAEPGRRYALRSAVGIAAFDPAAPETLTSLLRAADADLYAQKRARRAARAAAP
jgi:diguanylate cyclase (GGDEF)-like protein